MSGKNCIQKTNEELLGALGRFLLGAVTTSKGQRTTLFTIAVVIIMGIEFIVGTWTLISLIDMRLPNFGILIGGAVVLAMIMVSTLIYSITLYDNCTSDNGESE